MKIFKWFGNTSKFGSNASPTKVIGLLPKWLSKLIGIDIRITLWSKGSCTKTHMETRRFYTGFASTRCEIMLKSADKGGHFKLHTSEDSAKTVRLGMRLGKVFYIFRPDLIAHSVSPVFKGKRITLSVTWFTKTDTLDISKLYCDTDTALVAYYWKLRAIIEQLERPTHICVDPWSNKLESILEINSSTNALELTAFALYDRGFYSSLTACKDRVREALDVST